MERKAFLKIINESLRNVLGEDFDTNDNDEITKIVTSMIPLEDIIENEFNRIAGLNKKENLNNIYK